ncbi:MAG: ammonium transporter [Thermoplasmataceae archaeon]
MIFLQEGVQVAYQYLLNNIWVIFSALLIFLMTMAVGFLEVGEIGLGFSRSLMKTLSITAVSLVVMAFFGFNIAFAPTIRGVIGNPFYVPGLFLGGFSSSAAGLLTGAWWSTSASYSGTGLMTGSFFLFEATSAAVTFALVSVIFLNKVKFSVQIAFSVVYFLFIWTIPAAWIWNPSGWLYTLGMRDFAGGIVVHGAAGIAGLAIVLQIWREEKSSGHKSSPQVQYNVNETWLTFAILMLWIGWFGFNAGNVLAFNSDALVVVLTTFLSGAMSFVSMMIVAYLYTRKMPGLMDGVNGVLMGLIVITPLAGFVSPGSAIILGLVAGPIYFFVSNKLSKARRFSDPIGLFPGHLVGGIFGITMIAFFTESSFAAASGNPGMPNGLLFGGGLSALRQLGIEELGVISVAAFVFVVSFITMVAISKFMGGILEDSEKVTGVNKKPAGKHATSGGR